VVSKYFGQIFLLLLRTHVRIWSEELYLVMPSVVPGYEYDVFISYRQKDNKYDGWVTDFVSNLTKELEATSKQTLSIYFDENPQHGLAETHDVDQSLQDKIRCLVLIPIVSRTYCDPESFAWRNELLAFRDLAVADSFGLKIKVSNGDTASRILPVRIHEIDENDIKLLENEIRGRVRAIDFIYKAPGVNRPLRGQEEKLNSNSNHTVYRDQINKVANGVKELVDAMRQNGVAQSPSIAADKPAATQKVRKSPNWIPYIATVAVLVCIVLLGYFYFVPAIEEKPKRSITVLPFKTLSNDDEQKYFSYGIMDDIISKLYKVADLQVTSSTSAFVYQNSPKGTYEIGQELNVAYILEGSVRKDGKKVRISARLVKAADDKSVWSETFDENLENIFEMQSRVAERIVKALEITLSPSEEKQILKKRTTSALAFEFCEQGKFYNTLSGPDNLMKSRNFFAKALEIDPQYAEAYSGLAENDIAAIEWGYENPNQVSEKILENIEKAISIDSLLGEAYSALGAYHTYCSHDFVQAEKAFKIALSLNPGYDFTYFHYAVLEVIRGNQQHAFDLSRHALKLNPLSIKTNVYIAQKNYYLFKQYDKAFEEINKTLTLFPNDNFALWVLGTIEIQRGNYEQAVDAMMKRSVATKHTNWALGYIYAKGGEKEKALEILSFLMERGKTTYVPPSFIATIYVGLGNYDAAIEYMEKASLVNDYWLVYSHIDPCFEPLRKDPRFVRLLKTSHLNKRGSVSVGAK